MEQTPSAFSVAHYVLLFLVSTICTVSVVWVLIAANNRESRLNDKFISQSSNSQKSCQRRTADNVVILWESNYANVPEKYKIIETNYANRIVPVRTTGTCNGTRFICEMGDLRYQCDPCAKKSAYKRAMFQHISDAIDQECIDD